MRKVARQFIMDREMLWHCSFEVDAFAAYLWHHRAMKALKSPLATELLADPKARGELRRFLFTKGSSSVSEQQGVTGQFQIRRGTSAATVRAVLVPKAKAA